MNHKPTALLCAIIACAPFFAGCASYSGMQVALNERDAELRQLRDERVQLKERIQELQREKNSIEVNLLNASAPNIIGDGSSEGFDFPDFPELDELGFTIGQRDGNVVITLPSAITFNSGRAELLKEGKSGLLVVAQRLKQEYPNATYYIEGHTDADPISKSSFDSNRALSLARAMAVLDYLVGESGILDDDCVVVGHGQYMPVAANDGPENKARNRRVEIVVHDGRD